MMLALLRFVVRALLAALAAFTTTIVVATFASGFDMNEMTVLVSTWMGAPPPPPGARWMLDNLSVGSKFVVLQLSMSVLPFLAYSAWHVALGRARSVHALAAIASAAGGVVAHIKAYYQLDLPPVARGYLIEHAGGYVAALVLLSVLWMLGDGDVPHESGTPPRTAPPPLILRAITWLLVAPMATTVALMAGATAAMPNMAFFFDTVVGDGAAFDPRVYDAALATNDMHFLLHSEFALAGLIPSLVFAVGALRAPYGSARRARALGVVAVLNFGVLLANALLYAEQRRATPRHDASIAMTASHLRLIAIVLAVQVAPIVVEQLWRRVAAASAAKSKRA